MTPTPDERRAEIAALCAELDRIAAERRAAQAARREAWRRLDPDDPEPTE